MKPNVKLLGIMLLKKIVLKVEKRELKNVKEVLWSFKESKPEVSIDALRHGTLGEDTLVSFNVDEKHYEALIGKLNESGIRVLLPATKSEKENLAVKLKPKVISTNNAQGESNRLDVETHALNKRAINTPAAVLDATIENGNYEKVIQISKDFKSGFELIKKAKDNLGKAVTNAVNNAFEKASKSMFEFTSGFNQLIKIASDRNLKAMHLIDQQKTAGLYAINLCASRREYLNLLIQICNNNSIPNIVCLKASVELATMVLDEEDSNEDTEYAVRYLNIKWLQIVFDTTGDEITQKQKNSVKELISRVRKIRNERNL